MVFGSVSTLAWHFETTTAPRKRERNIWVSGERGRKDTRMDDGELLLLLGQSGKYPFP